MKNLTLNYIVGPALAAVLLAGCASHEQKQARLQAEAKITRVEAEKIALTKAPNGTVKEAELEKEDGKLIWSFDITTPGSKEITEVAVNAINGEVVSVENESAEKEAKEKSGDAKKEKD